jgi:methylmalonyl-CoA/ethylmalonyl-CoA epimerase
MPELSLSTIGQISLNAHDIERAAQFYSQKLGMKMLFKFPPKLAFFDAAGVRLMLSTPEKPEFDHPGSIVYFKVGDIQEAWGVLSGRGVEFEGNPQLVARMPDHDLWMAFFRDSEGNLLALMSEAPRS